ncbi:hypothetical protein ACHHYP_06878 [Achlya hypogyna]|uniref:Transmembrane protein n=1 Tax=Achlya hypogyna TaxID=1202772 RepID=A0A1V9YRL8_ACHHY|nr:hypothetical protein ACHHYP_06878 [Achlya hypogyna]
MRSSRVASHVTVIHVAPHRDVIEVSALRGRQRVCLLTVLFLIGCLWNLLSPFKTWILAEYGFASQLETTTVTLNWDTVLNGRFLTQLYTNAGIPLAGPLVATRYVNVFIDFMAVPRSVVQWATAPSLSPFQRTGLVFDPSSMPLSGPYVVPVDSEASLAGVTEAQLCLRGFSLDAYLDEAGIKVEAADRVIWGASMFPRLPACLARRATLLADRKDVVALAAELAASHNLSGVSVAGGGLLYAPVTFLDGYLDLTGERSGLVTYHLYGRSPVATSELHVLSPIAAVAQFCTSVYVDPKTLQRNTSQCFQSEAAAAYPANYLGAALSSQSSPYLDNAAFTASTSTGLAKPYKYTNRKQAALADIEYVAPGNVSAWNHLFQQLVASVTAAPVDTTTALEELCLVGDGCVSSCMNASASGGTTVTYRRSGVCEAAVDTVAHGLADVFVDMKCFGLGTGSSSIQVTYMSKDGVRHTATATNTASPVAIVACFIGGRAPQTDYPSALMDMLTQGTQASMAVTLANGSEAIILNFIALVSLVGYGYFCWRTAQLLFRVLRWFLRTKGVSMQVRYSIVNCSIGSIVWRRHSTAMWLVGFVSFLSWHIGAASMRCSWAAHVADLRHDAEYGCSIDSLGHVASAGAWLRLVSYAWVFFALTALDRLPGITVCARGYMVATVVLGLLPLVLLAFVVAEVCKLRLLIPGLAWLHNYLFLALVWGAVLAGVRCVPLSPLLAPCMSFVAVRLQSIDTESPWHALVGPEFWIDAAFCHPVPVKYVPLSLLMEMANIDVGKVVDHAYYPAGLATRQQLHHPDWIHDQWEYFVCLPHE